MGLTRLWLVSGFLKLLCWVLLRVCVLFGGLGVGGFGGLSCRVSGFRLWTNRMRIQVLSFQGLKFRVQRFGPGLLHGSVHSDSADTRTYRNSIAGTATATRAPDLVFTFAAKIMEDGSSSCSRPFCLTQSHAHEHMSMTVAAVLWGQTGTLNSVKP